MGEGAVAGWGADDVLFREAENVRVLAVAVDPLQASRYGEGIEEYAHGIGQTIQITFPASGTNAFSKAGTEKQYLVLECETLMQRFNVYRRGEFHAVKVQKN